MSRITIDPVTRIEGHLKIEVEVDQGVVINAWSSGTLFRGIEKILIGRQPEDAWLFTQRLCGVCTHVHAVTSIRSVENVGALQIPKNARVIRNLLMGAQFVHDHPVHFYHLQALDFVDIVSALKADAAAAARLAAQISPQAPAMDFVAVKEKLNTFVNGGQLGIFNGGYWGHPVYVLSPEENLIFAAHYLDALRKQVSAAQMMAIFGGKNPHTQSLKVGGATCGLEITTANISKFRSLLVTMRDFIDKIYIPDVIYLATKYKDWGSIGGFVNYLSYGEFPQSSAEPDSCLFPRGIIENKNIASVGNVNVQQIAEHVAHSWYSGTSSLHPSQGETNPQYTNFDTASRYSWLKAPRYNSKPMEVGPLARVLVAYGKGVAPVVSAVNAVLQATGLTASQLHSTLGRSAARAIETQVIANAMDSWLNELTVNGTAILSDFIIPGGNSSGYALNEAPRGALGHWIAIKNQKIANYQMVVPSTWNFGPRCSGNLPGPVETALIGTPVVDITKPVEILRVVHSFDPCIACAVHVVDKTTKQNFKVRIS